ncbi:MAG: NADH-quinone oxidoreductase subunit D [Spirosomataceae bacterium]|jgi:NADH-quinone oxidoreductase subunit D
MQKIQYKYKPENLSISEPTKFSIEILEDQEMLINLGPQHPSTHGVLRLEVVTDGELIKEVVPHMGYLHRCFEKHAENLPFNQIIPYVDRLDYVATLNSEHAYAMGVEKMLGITEIPPRVEYIRVLVAELNRLASHFLAVGTYAQDLGASTPFLWLFRDRETILRMLEWVSGARLLYNYIWVGGLFYDLPVGFEEKCREFVDYVKPKLVELQQLIIENQIFIKRTAGVGVLPIGMAVNFGCTGPVLRGSGLKYDLRRVDGYSVYPEIEFEIPIGEGKMGKTGDSWDRTYVRVLECWESLKIIDQCIELLTKKHIRNKSFNPQIAVPKKIRPVAMDFYTRAENPKGELGFYFRTNGKTDVPDRLKCRSCSFHNLSVLPELSKGMLVADLVTIIGSLDLVMGEVDR